MHSRIYNLGNTKLYEDSFEDSLPREVDYVMEIYDFDDDELNDFKQVMEQVGEVDGTHVCFYSNKIADFFTEKMDYFQKEFESSCMNCRLIQDRWKLADLLVDRFDVYIAYGDGVFTFWDFLEYIANEPKKDFELKQIFDYHY